MFLSLHHRVDDRLSRFTPAGCVGSRLMGFGCFVHTGCACNKLDYISHGFTILHCSIMDVMRV